MRVWLTGRVFSVVFVLMMFVVDVFVLVEQFIVNMVVLVFFA